MFASNQGGPMRFRLLTLTATVFALVLTLAAPAAASTPLVEFTDNGFVPSSVVLDEIRLNVGASLDIHNSSSQNVVFCEQVSEPAVSRRWARTAGGSSTPPTRP